MNSRTAALNTGPDFHLLDHIAPLASFLDIPLLISEEENFSLAKRYYPNTTLRYLPNLEENFSAISQEFDALFESKYWTALHQHLFSQLHKKKMRLFFCPHGQSDKGFHAPLLAPYQFQDGVLIYGSLMLEMLKTLQIPLPPHAIVGNYRYSYYILHKKFYDSLVQREIFSAFPTQNPTLLYAPTWDDADNSTSFFHALPSLLSSLPSHWNLLIKAHPLLEQRDPARFYTLSADIEKRPNTQLLLQFPLIYPLLARCDAYLGDYSSIGYDFLKFERPMFFFQNPTLPKGFLSRCGRAITLDQLASLRLENPFKNEQRELYKRAFGDHSGLTGGRTNTVLTSLMCPSAGRAVSS
jgi:hypothetical protein